MFSLKSQTEVTVLQWVCLQTGHVFSYSSESLASCCLKCLHWCPKCYPPDGMVSHSGHFAKHRPNRNCHINWRPVACLIVQFCLCYRSVLSALREDVRSTTAFLQSLFLPPRLSSSHKQRLMFSMNLKVCWCFQK